MKPETALFFDKARDQLRRAETMLGVALHDDAGRAAYLAGFHAAQALLFETRGRIFKKHASVQGEFGRIVKDDGRFDPYLRTFLPRAYNLKALADYETGPGSHISAEGASDAARTARRFVEAVEALAAENRDRQAT